MSRSLERYRDALARVVTELARGADIHAKLERELVAAEIAAIGRGAPVELFDDLALHERALRTRSR